MGFMPEKDEIKKLIILVDLGGTGNRYLYTCTITISTSEVDSSMYKPIQYL